VRVSGKVRRLTPLDKKLGMESGAELCPHEAPEGRRRTPACVMLRSHHAVKGSCSRTEQTDSHGGVMATT